VHRSYDVRSSGRAPAHLADEGPRDDWYLAMVAFPDALYIVPSPHEPSPESGETPQEMWQTGRLWGLAAGLVLLLLVMVASNYWAAGYR
jgi:hypothetical protein